MALMSITFANLHETQRMLADLPRNIQKRIIGKATRAAAKPVLAAARANARQLTRGRRGLKGRRLRLATQKRFETAIAAGGGKAHWKRTPGTMSQVIARALHATGRKMKGGIGYHVIIRPSRRFNDVLTYQSASGKTSYIPSAIEYGHVVGTRSGKGIGKWMLKHIRTFGEAIGSSKKHIVPPKPFMRPAFDSTKERAATILENTLVAGIQAEVQKGNKHGT